MVVDEMGEERVDRPFHVLADTARRDIPRRGARDELPESRLAEACPMSFAAVHKHVAVLEGAGVVTKQRRGREQFVRTGPLAVDRVRQAFDGLETALRGRVERVSHLLAQDTDTGGHHPTEGQDR
ncbi:ArsR/SmtB family transcription factor [Streptomyces flaveolus]|uniref:ArsR/SmtB family transcription factor n=1 Tax=Streptomyces flaveolus TaxID=67297 RepID=UPI00369E7C77